MRASIKKISTITATCITFIIFFSFITGCSEDSNSSTIDGDTEQEKTEIEKEAAELEEEAEIETELEIEEESEPEKEWEDPGFDKYQGSLYTTTKATGFFRVEEIDGQWWLITPEGHPFFSAGHNVVGTGGTAMKDGKKRYLETVEKKYESHEAWAETQTKNLLEWGWNSIGCWSQYELFREKLPYTIMIYVLAQDIAAYDLFSDEFAQKVDEVLSKKIPQYKDDKFLIGYFFDNESSWVFNVGELKMVSYITAYMEKEANSPGKTKLIDFLKDHYKTFDKLLVDFKTDAKDFDDLQNKNELKPNEEKGNPVEGAAKANQVWTGIIADKYFGTIDTTFRKYDPNHMNLGSRFVSQLVPEAVIEAAGRYVDVMTINFYEMEDYYIEFLQGLDSTNCSIDNMLEAHYKAGGKPILISEWGYRSKETEHPCNAPPLYPTLENEQARADAYSKQFEKMLETKWIVGQHWFLFADQPPEGRFDGENNNFGIVTEYDEPYPKMIEASKEMFKKIYPRLMK